MKKLSIATAAMIAAFAAPALAQGGAVSSRCSSGNLQDACQKAQDVFGYMTPQFGTSLAGGNTILGSAGSLGGLGHFSVGVRANAIKGSLPDVEQFTVRINGAARETLPTKDQVLGAPAVEVGLGLFGGIPLGLTSVGGVDAIVSAMYLPNYDNDNFSVEASGGSLKLGYGARIGLLKETLLVPGLSVSVLKRDTPELRLVAATEGGALGTERDEFELSSFQVKTTSWRLTASKGLTMFGVAAGVGQDKYDSGADLSVTVREGAVGTCSAATPCSGTFRFDNKITRTTYFGDVALNLPFVKIVGEIGQASGGNLSQPTFNDFADRKANGSQLFGSVGVRLAF